MSPELTKIVAAFSNLDQEHMSLNGACEETQQRTFWQNALGMLLYVISCGLIAKNPELDRATSKIISLAKDFFRSEQINRDDLAGVHLTLSKLKTIISINQGSKYSAVDTLANRAFRLLRGEKVEPLEVDPHETLHSLLRRSAPLPLLAAKIKELCRKGKVSDITHAFASVQSDNDRFLQLFFMVIHYSRDNQWAMNILQDAAWPSEELKIATLEAFLEDPTALCPPPLPALIQESELNLDEIKKRIESIRLYHDYDELLDAFILIKEDKDKFENLAQVIRSHAPQITPFLATIEWPSEEMKATLLTIE